MGNGVVQQVAGEFAQHPGVGQHRAGFAADFKVKRLVCDQGRQIERHAARGLRPVQHGKVFLLAHLFNLGQGQHLVGQGGGAVYRGLYLAQGRQGCEVAAQCGLHLGLEHGQRRAQLVGGVADKAFLVV